MFQMTVSDIFYIKGRGLVATGQVEAGTVHKGDKLLLNGAREVEVSGIEAFRKILDEAGQGMNIGLLLKDLTRDDIKGGDVLTDAAAATQAPASPFQPIPDATLQSQQDDINRALGRE